MKTAAINDKAADLKARVIAYCDERALQLGGLVARLKAGEALDEANAKELTTYCDQEQCLTLGGLVDEVWQLRNDYHASAKAQQTHYVLAGRSFAVAAEFTDDDTGTVAANQYMAAHPGVGVLAVDGGRVILASNSDKGESVPRPAKYLMNPATGSVDTEENWLAEMPSWEGDQQAQFNSLIEMAPITKDDEPRIQEWLNCLEASVDSEGDVWVEGPMTGHWLSDEKKAEYLEWRGL